jgi:hypothetical protein
MLKLMITAKSQHYTVYTRTHEEFIRLMQMNGLVLTVMKIHVNNYGFPGIKVNCESRPGSSVQQRRLSN